MVELRPRAGAFEERARTQVRELRSAYARLLTSLGAPARPDEVAQRLGIERDLAWKLRRLVDAIDPLAVAECVPDEMEVEGLVRGAIARGIPRERLDALIARTREFHGFAVAQTGDRQAFDTLASSLAQSNAETIQLEARRSAFQANAMIVGKRCRESVLVHGVAPHGDDSGRFDSFVACGNVGFERRRRSASTILTRHFFREHAELQMGELAPLDLDEALRFGAPILERFSSPELGERVDRTREGDNVTLRMRDEAVTESKPFTFMWGHRVEGFEWEGDTFTARVCSQTPTRRITLNLLLHDAIAHGPAEYRVIGGHLPQDSWPAAEDPESITHGVSLQDLGYASERRSTDGWEREAELIHHGVECMGWDPTRLRRYRLQVEYPVHLSLARLRCARL